MNALKNLTDQLQLIWSSSTPAARVSIGTLVLLCVGLVVGVGYWSAQPSYVTLVSDVDAAIMSDVVAGLERAGIEYQLTGAGATLQVDKRNYARAKQLATKSGAGVDNLALESAPGFGSGPGWENEVRRRNQEKQIAASLMRFPSVEKAIVHLSLPDAHPFIRQRIEPKASVLLTVKASVHFGEQQAQAMAVLVANAVVGLTPMNVSITDTDGKAYTTGDEGVVILTRQEDYRLERERILTSRAQQQLAHLGYDNFTVSVTADFDFKQANMTRTVYDPEGKVVSTETNKKEKTTSVDDLAAGTAGVQANLTSSTGTNVPGTQLKTDINDSTFTYLNAMTETVEVDQAPNLTKLTVSVVVNDKAQGVTDAQGAVLPKVEEGIKDTIKNAVGFLDDRDSISVIFAPFQDIVAPEVTSAPIPWQNINEIVRNVSLGIAALVALLLGFMTLRKMKPAPLADNGAATGGTANTAGVSQLGDLLKNNPDAFAQIIAAWANSGDANSSAPSKPGEKKAA